MEQTSAPARHPNRLGVFQFIVRYKRACDGNSPTYREIMRACRLASLSGVHYHLNKLERQGRIRRVPRRRACSIVVVGGTWVAPTQERIRQRVPRN